MLTMRMGLALLVVGLFGSTGASAASQTFTAKLDGASEVPKVDSKAAGDGTFTVSEDGKKIEYMLTVHDLKDVTMAHVHIGAMGKNGPIVVWLYPASGKPQLMKEVENGELAKGEITETSLQGPDKGKPLSVLVKAMRDGDAYVNVHTARHKPGEIRGQIK